jgi:3',5'-cyclic AMP phosphodiesterase CpdA
VRAALAFALLALGCKRDAARAAPPVSDAGAPAVAAAGGGGAARLTRAASRDVTFLALSDTHLGYVPEDVHAALVPKLDDIAGRAYPRELEGTVATPRALVITGDLTERGKDDEWQRIMYFYGTSRTTASNAGLKVPVFEVVGNHDKVHGPYVTDQVAARHGGKPYAWDLDDLHFVALGEAPDDDALAWLARDLARVDSDVPLVVYFHLALLGPWSTGNWFADGDYKERLAKLLEGRCVAAIVHGHHHASGRYAWHGFPVYKPGAVKDNAHTFAVFHAAGATLSVAYFDYDKDAWTWSESRALCP